MDNLDLCKAVPAPVYLGDGVYASFDSYHIWLAVGHHANKVIALEPVVLQALIKYAQGINTHYGSTHFQLST